MAVHNILKVDQISNFDCYSKKALCSLLGPPTPPPQCGSCVLSHLVFFPFCSTEFSKFLACIPFSSVLGISVEVSQTYILN